MFKVKVNKQTVTDARQQKKKFDQAFIFFVHFLEMSTPPPQFKGSLQVHYVLNQ